RPPPLEDPVLMDAMAEPMHVVAEPFRDLGQVERLGFIERDRFDLAAEGLPGSPLLAACPELRLASPQVFVVAPTLRIAISDFGLGFCISMCRHGTSCEKLPGAASPLLTSGQRHRARTYCGSKGSPASTPDRPHGYSSLGLSNRSPHVNGQHRTAA